MTELYLFNGRFHTQDPAHPHATAVAICHGRFQAIGTDHQIRSLAARSPHTGSPGHVQTIDLEGKLVLPGLTDAHFHFYDWALGLQRLPLAGTASLVDLCHRLALRARKVPAGRWILGQGWNETHWPVPRLPSRADLDEVAPHHPVILWRSDLHVAVTNSLALHQAGITANTPDPPEGVIDRDPSGQPTGVLRELAINLVREVIPPPTEAETVTAMREALPALHRLGLTSVHDYRLMGGADGPPAFRAYQRLQASGQLALRLWMQLPGELLDQAIALGLRTGFGDGHLCIGHVKLFSDGAQGARTAWMLDPYQDTEHRGMPLTPMDDIANAIRSADRAGLAVAVHAIGDRANHELVSVFEQILASAKQAGQPRPSTSAPHRIEHVQNIRPDDVARLGQLGIVASAQPIHVTDDMSMIEQSVGERACYAYPFRDMLDAGVILALGSDCPVADPNPWWGIHAAVTRQRRDGTPPDGWYPAQRMTVAEAVWGFTMGPALASGQDSQAGSISVGKLADLVVLDRDIFRIQPAEIAHTAVDMTILGGKIVHQR